MRAYLSIVPTDDELITITAAAQLPPARNQHPRLRVDAVISAGARVGQTIHREYVLDGNSIPARRALLALARATGVQLTASGDETALVGKQVIDAPKLGPWRTQPITNDDHVRTNLAETKDGGVRASGANIERILRESSELAGRIRYNVITNDVEITDGEFAGLAHGLDVAITNWLETDWKLYAKSHVVGEQLLYVARRHGSYDPLRGYLEGLTWDGTKRIDTWLSKYCGVKRSKHATRVGAKWLVSAVARALDPGCKVDTMLILRGLQGAKKSTVFDVLGGEWFSDTPLDPHSKDARITASSTWIIEMAELSAIKRSDVESLKAFLSARRDRVRPPYGRTDEIFLRRCVFCGTTNEDEFLIDTTGNRRFWIVHVVNPIEIDALKQDRDQLWAEAVARYRTGAKWWLDAVDQQRADEVAEEHEVASPWVDLVSDYLSRNTKTHFKLDEIAWAALNVSKSELERQKHAVTKALKKAGLVNRLDTHPKGAERERWWIREEP